MRIIGHCPICKSDAYQNWKGVVQCPNNGCNGWSDTEWALRDVRRWYMTCLEDGLAVYEDVKELERRIWQALTSPPRRARGTTVFR